MQENNDEVRVKVLYVEDDKIDQLAFKRFVKQENHPYDFTIAETIEEAKDYLDKDNFDIIITDYLLSDGTAFDVLDTVKDIPIIFLTGAGDEEIAIKAMKSGAYDYLVKDVERNYLKFLSVAIDTTIHRRQTEAQLRLLETAISSQTDVAVMLVDITGKIRWVNKGFKHVTGYDIDEVKGTYGEVLKHGEQTSLTKYAEEIVNTKKSVSYEAQFFSKDNREYWALIHLIPVFNNKEDVIEILSLITDITARKKFEEELKASKERAERSEKIKEEFLANMSHEIRTPLNVIMGMSSLLFKTQPTKEQLEYLNAIKLSADNLLVIINDILDLSKIEAGKMTFENKEFIVSELVENIAQTLQFRVEEKGLKLNTNIDSKIPKVIIGDSVRLNQILLNLVSNAIKFTEKGQVEVGVKVVNESEKEVTLQFDVKDTGIGLSEDVKETIFESFTQAKSDTTRKYGGTGLGLTIVKKLVSLQKGEIKLDSKIGEGSTFSVILTFQKGESGHFDDLKDKHEQASFAKFENVKILLVEDNELNQLLATKLLGSWGLDMDVADNGKIAIEYLEKNDDYAMVLMDIQMPEMDGYQATRHIRANLAAPKNDIPIVAMTAHAIEGEVEKGKKAGMNGYISKPLDQEKLYNIIKKYAEKSDV